MKASNLNRREFIKRSGVAAGALAVAPYVLAEDKAGTRLPVIGTGAYQYEVIHDWGELPAGHVYGNTHGVAVDAQGHVHIKHTVGAGAKTEDAIVVFDADGKFVRSWGRQYKGGAHGLHLSREGGEEFFYLCDPKRHLFAKTTLEGRELWRKWAPEQCNGYTNPDEFNPTNIAIAPNGDVFVGDGYGKSFIHQYDRDAKYIRSFGGKGKEPGRTDCPHGLMVDTRGEQPVLVVADRGNRRLQNFTLAGQHLNFVTEEMHAPCHFHVYGGVMVVPDLESRVTLLDRNNRLLVHLGAGPGYNGLRTKSRDHFTPGQFVAPHSACFDHDGNLFVVEWVEVGRVTKLRKLA
ncbi:MAG: twin-arginine translocation signal domain-containing protein [Verrucomicrobiota bacterium]